MSSLDPHTSAQLADRRKKEMSAKIKELSASISAIIRNMRKMEAQAQALLLKPDYEGDSHEFKKKILSDLMEVNKFIGAATVAKLACQDFFNAPEPDTTATAIAVQPTPVNSNLQDIFGSPRPSTSSTQSIDNYNISNINQGQAAEINENTGLPGQLTEIAGQLQGMQIRDTPSVSNIPQGLVLPTGSTLEIDRVYNVYIINAKALNIWVIIDDHHEMFYEWYDYNSNQHHQVWNKFIPIELLHHVTYCIAFVEETSSWARCYMMNPYCTETHAHVYLVDTSENTLVPKHTIMPLQHDFFLLTHVCLLAGINSLDQSPITLAAITNFILQFRGRKCKLEVANRSSETVACYFRMEYNMTINHMLVENYLAVHIEGQCTCNSVQEKNMTTQAAFAPETLAPTNEAVGQDAQVSCTRTQFPSRTSYEVEVTKSYDAVRLLHGPKIPPPILPEPGANIAVFVSHVVDLKTFYVQIADPPRPPQPRVFGQILPPETLEDLESAMNTRAIIPTYRRLESPPLPGDVVAAIFPSDELYYRARVVQRGALETTIVQYVDYGNELCLPDTKIFQLHPQFIHLPCQSILCTLPEVDSSNTTPENIARMKNFLCSTTQNKQLKARVISRSPEQIQVSLFYPDGRNVAKKMADTLVVRYQPCDSDANE